jgi:ubiquinone/menaquinone biosynthesis C-methylase UbiE
MSDLERRPGTPTSEGGRHYLPAMGRRWLLPLYDPLTRLFGVTRVHRELVARADIRPGHRVLEIGCGTGNLLLAVHRRHPDATLVGLDPDPDAVRRAGRKAVRAGLSVQLDRGFAGELPYPDASVDRVLSAFMLHHLDRAEESAAVREIARVLRPGGQLHIVDIAGAAPSHGLLGRLAHRSHHHGEPGADRIRALLQDAGLTDIAVSDQDSTRIGRYAFHRASR